MLVAVAVGRERHRLEQAALAAVALAQVLEMEQPEQSIPEAVAVEVRALDRAETAAQAAPASSFSSTTSALPRSSPSSHRRSGLHQRVR